MNSEGKQARSFFADSMGLLIWVIMIFYHKNKAGHMEKIYKKIYRCKLLNGNEYSQYFIHIKVYCNEGKNFNAIHLFCWCKICLILDFDVVLLL